jgi:hypothetical protein
MFIKSKNPKNTPININNVERVLCAKIKQNKVPVIKFEMVSGGSLVWEYDTKIQRDEEFNKILGNTLNEG